MKKNKLTKEVKKDLKNITSKGKETINDFKAFALKGNVMDLAIGVIIGGAFGKIVTSLVNDVVMPLLSVVTGKLDFTNMFYALDGKTYETLALAKESGAATINYGVFITSVIDFLLVALSIFFMIKQLQKFKKKETVTEEPAKILIKTCPYCQSEIHINAKKCPHCTSDLKK